MADIPISVGDLFQGGRVQAVDSSIGQTYLRYSAELTTDNYVFSFPAAAGSALTFGIPRSIFVDNSENDYSLRVVVSGTQQAFPVPANSSGTYNIDAQQSSSITITSAGASGSGNPVEFIFYNYDRTPFVWYKFGVSNVTVNIPDGADVAMGETTDAPVTNPALAGTLIGITKGVLTGINLAVTRLTSLLFDTGALVLSNASILTNTNAYSFANINTATTTVVKNAPGILGRVIINSLGTIASTTTIYDNTAGSGTVIGIIDSLTQSGTFEFEVIATIGITVVTTGTVAPDVTVTYK